VQAARRLEQDVAGRKDRDLELLGKLDGLLGGLLAAHHDDGGDIQDVGGPDDLRVRQPREQKTVGLGKGQDVAHQVCGEGRLGRFLQLVASDEDFGLQDLFDIFQGHSVLLWFRKPACVPDAAGAGRCRPQGGIDGTTVKS